MLDCFFCRVQKCKVYNRHSHLGTFLFSSLFSRTKLFFRVLHVLYRIWYRHCKHRFISIPSIIVTTGVQLLSPHSWTCLGAISLRPPSSCVTIDNNKKRCLKGKEKLQKPGSRRSIWWDAELFVQLSLYSIFLIASVDARALSGISPFLQLI